MLHVGDRVRKLKDNGGAPEGCLGTVRQIFVERGKGSALVEFDGQGAFSSVEPYEPCSFDEIAYVSTESGGEHGCAEFPSACAIVPGGHVCEGDRVRFDYFGAPIEGTVTKIFPEIGMAYVDKGDGDRAEIVSKAVSVLTVVSPNVEAHAAAEALAESEVEQFVQDAEARAPALAAALTTLPTDYGKRKGIPIATGVLDYFPAAIAAVARVSKAGNDKHNPGQALHWSRGKSDDHADCALRHFVERGTIEPDTGEDHLALACWRMLALLQLTEEARGAPVATTPRPRVSE